MRTRVKLKTSKYTRIGKEINPDDSEKVSLGDAKMWSRPATGDSEFVS